MVQICQSDVSIWLGDVFVVGVDSNPILPVGALDVLVHVSVKMVLGRNIC